MDIKIYKSLGLSPNEAKIYEALVEKGESSISQIAIAGKIHRRNAYDAINRLINKGLCFLIVSSKENRYNAVDPNKLTELVAEQKTELDKALPELLSKFRRREVPEEAYIYRGLEGQKNIFRDMLRVGKDSYFIGAKGGWYDPKIEAARVAFFKEANKKGIKFIQLFDHEIKVKMPEFPGHFSGKLQFRFLPKEYATNSAIHIFGDYVITYTGLVFGKVSDDIVFFVIRSKDLAESYRTWFWYMWEQSKEQRKINK
ncbi:MAG: helix-turn-helix domain-containing protein [bacterium]|nr:helix-turn-helix domain-containing protein [bacterium]